MKYLRKIRTILQAEGISGLIRVLYSRLNSDSQSMRREAAAEVETAKQAELAAEMETAKKAELAAEIEIAKKTYQDQVDTFTQYAANTNFPGIEHFYWYHTVEVENGIVTPGDYDYRNSLEGFHFPEEMTGLRVLDVGSATGFFAFEFARRGATVVSVELPSLAEWDMIHDEKRNILHQMMDFHHATTPEEAFYRHLDGPFKFCRIQKKASVERVYSSIYDLSSHLNQNEAFDLVFLGDVLLHLFSPFAALNVIAPLCKSKLIVATDLFDAQDNAPLMRFLGTMSKDGDARTWWMFNETCVREMLFRVGFKNVEQSGEYSGIMRRTWTRYHRHVFHATK